MKRITLVMGLILVSSLLMVACGGGGPPAVEASVVMTDFAFAPVNLDAPAGAEITLNLSNDGALEHNFVIMNAGSDVTAPWSDSDQSNVFFEETATVPDDSVTTTFIAPAQAGTYQIVCSVPAHLEAGMEGTLTVTQ